MTGPCLPRDFVNRVDALGAMQALDGTVAPESRDEGIALASKVGLEAASLAFRFRQETYGQALGADFRDWIASGLQDRPDFCRSRDALAPPRDGAPFFFAGPLRLANGGREGWRMECFLALREEPDSEAYRSLYSMYPHPGNICQSSHLLIGSRGLVSGNNIVFFPENIQAEAPLEGQAYAVFFFNKFHRIYNSRFASSAARHRGSLHSIPLETTPARPTWHAAYGATFMTTTTIRAFARSMKICRSRRAGSPVFLKN